MPLEQHGPWDSNELEMRGFKLLKRVKRDEGKIVNDSDMVEFAKQHGELVTHFAAFRIGTTTWGIFRSPQDNKVYDKARKTFMAGWKACLDNDNRVITPTEQRAADDAFNEWRRT